MGTVIGAILALLFLEGPWRIIVPTLLLMTDVFSIIVWLRWRKRPSVTGSEGLVGLRGIALTDCRPDGQVKVKGQLWKARATEPVYEGDEIVVVDSSSMTLEVLPAAASPAAAGERGA